MTQANNIQRLSSSSTWEGESISLSMYHLSRCVGQIAGRKKRARAR